MLEVFYGNPQSEASSEVPPFTAATVCATETPTQEDEVGSAAARTATLYRCVVEITQKTVEAVTQYCWKATLLLSNTVSVRLSDCNHSKNRVLLPYAESS